MDLVGPLPASEDGYLYILTMVDRTTHWLEAVPLKNMSASLCVETFLSSWVARFGVPETLTSDRGTQFSSAAWAAFCSKLGTRHVMTMAYHPQANGLVERTHRQLKCTPSQAGRCGLASPSPLGPPWPPGSPKGGQQFILHGGSLQAASSDARRIVSCSRDLSHGLPGEPGLRDPSGDVPASHVC